MFLPPYLQRWILLNTVRLLTIIACALVIGSTIDRLRSDVSAYHSSSASANGYHTGTNIPSIFLGVFWTSLHQIYLTMVLFVVLLSEISLPVPTLHRFFKNSLPFLGPNWGTGLMGALLVLLASDTLSRGSQSGFSLASSWILAITGVINVIVGTVWRAKGKLLRSPTAWQHSVAQRTDKLADVKAQAEKIIETNLELPGPVSAKQTRGWRSVFRRRPSHSDTPTTLKGLTLDVTGPIQRAELSQSTKTELTTRSDGPMHIAIALPQRPVNAVQFVPSENFRLGMPPAVPFVPQRGSGQQPPPETASVRHLVKPFDSSLQESALAEHEISISEDTHDDSDDSSIGFQHTPSSSYSSQSTNEHERSGRAALLEALSGHCAQLSTDTCCSQNSDRENRAPKAVRFESSETGHAAHSSLSSIYTDPGQVTFSSSESDESIGFTSCQQLGVSVPDINAPLLSPSVVAFHKAAILEAEAKARNKKLKKSLYLGSDKWLAERQKDAAVPSDTSSSSSRPYHFL